MLTMVASTRSMISAMRIVTSTIQRQRYGVPVEPAAVGPALVDVSGGAEMLIDGSLRRTVFVDEHCSTHERCSCQVRCSLQWAYDPVALAADPARETRAYAEGTAHPGPDRGRGDAGDVRARLRRDLDAEGRAGTRHRTGVAVCPCREQA